LALSTFTLFHNLSLLHFSFRVQTQPIVDVVVIISIMVAPMEYKKVSVVMESWEKVRRLPDYLEIVGPKLFSK
jgi:hypothetical protein